MNHEVNMNLFFIRVAFELIGFRMNIGMVLEMLCNNGWDRPHIGPVILWTSFSLTVTGQTGYPHWFNPLQFPITLSLRSNYRCATLHRSLSMRQHGREGISIEKLSGGVWRTVVSVPRRMPGVGCQSTICRRRIRLY